MNIDDEIIYASSFKRGIAITIDIFIVLFLRIFVAQILGMIWLNKVLLTLSADFKSHFGSEAIENQEHIAFILSHFAFKQIIIFYILIILVGTIYHAYLNSSSWKATIGKRVMNIMILDKNFDKVSFLRAFAHYFASLIPMVIIIYLFVFQSYFQINFVKAITANYLNIALSIVAVLWINIHSFTGRKTTAHDLICKTLFIDGKSIAKKPWQKLEKDDI